MEYNYIDIGDRLIKLRKARGYSQDKLIVFATVFPKNQIKHDDICLFYAF